MIGIINYFIMMEPNVNLIVLIVGFGLLTLTLILIILIFHYISYTLKKLFVFNKFIEPDELNIFNQVGNLVDQVDDDDGHL